MHSLTYLPATGDVFATASEPVLTCIGRFITRPGVVRAKDGGGSVLDLTLTAGGWKMVRAAQPDPI